MQDPGNKAAMAQATPSIANEMIVAVSTVKWHIKHIYGKLDVHSRTQVLARTRELGLLI